MSQCMFDAMLVVVQRCLEGESMGQRMFDVSELFSRCGWRQDKDTHAHTLSFSLVSLKQAHAHTHSLSCRPRIVQRTWMTDPARSFTTSVTPC